MKSKWYRVGIMFKEGIQKYICQFDSALKKSVFSKKDSDFVKLKKVRWLDQNKKGKKNKKTTLVRLENFSMGEYLDYFYIRKEFIESIWPLEDMSLLND